MARVLPEPFVLGSLDAENLQALAVGAFADELEGGREGVAVPSGQSLVDPAEEDLVLRQAAVSLRYVGLARAGSGVGPRSKPARP